MSPDGDETREQLEHLFKCYCETGLTLAALAVIRRSEATASDACKNISMYTADTMIVDETKLARELDDLTSRGFLERNGDRYRITQEGKSLMYQMLRQWNRYVDSMNNLWGCYYGA